MLCTSYFNFMKNNTKYIRNTSKLANIVNRKHRNGINFRNNYLHINIKTY